MSKPGRPQEPGRRPQASAPPARDGWPPPGSRTPPRSKGAPGRRTPVPGGTRRVRAWPAAGRDRLAVERVELATLEQGIRFRAIFLTLMGIILAIGASDVLAGAAGLFRETAARPLTSAEQARYIKDDIAGRWHTWSTDLVFPVELQYIGLGRTQQYARRVGLAPEVSCRSGVDAPTGSVLAQYGCRTLLRASYVDQSSTFVITVGIAVLRDEEARIAATAQLPVDDRVGVRPVAFPGTATELFGAAQRQRNGWVPVGPYVVFSTAGYSDGRTRESIPREEILHSELWPTAQAVAGRIARALGDEPSAVPQCTQGNVC
ncbi:hypothetical protein FHR32_001712 [Streptosporangium album]|uniref:Uncharacterized protein n=1 Tax=Streptosporangium album TaxID=47479 RepID=A0A7W7W7K3_9ACTN|nr:hypothetical protein [Streptosporangium album]MBB4937407.1 hypothetical protein [Streptosporangium album]